MHLSSAQRGTILPSTPDTSQVNVVIVAQDGRLAYEALLFALSFRKNVQGQRFRLIVAEPQAGPHWQDDPTIRAAPLRALILAQGAEIIPFESKVFGSAYPYGNKIEALFALPPGEPFVFFDTDTLMLGHLHDVPFDFARPSASLRVEATWPRPLPGGPDHAAIWRALYTRFGLDFDTSLATEYPAHQWQRYLYFNAGFFYYRCPHVFARCFRDIALSIWRRPPPELDGQALVPWLDQIALPLVIHALGGGRAALPSGFLDGKTTVHYRNMPLLYARESDAVLRVLEDVTAPHRIKRVLKTHHPFRRMIYQSQGQRVRALFDQNALPQNERAIRQKIRKNGLWVV